MDLTDITHDVTIRLTTAILLISTWQFCVMKYIIIVFFLALTLMITNSVLAANCKPIYGGGTITPCINPTGMQTEPKVTTAPQQKTQPTQPQGFAPQGNMTKGGLVYPSQPSTTTPPTGPEDIGLIVLATSGLLGVIVRRATAKA